MIEPRPSRVLGGLPRSRPHRRSQRRPPAQPSTPAEPGGSTVVSDPAPAAAGPKRQAGSGARKPKRQAPTAQAKSRSAQPATAKGAAATPKRPAAIGRSAPTARAATTGRTAPTARAATTGRTAPTARAATTGRTAARTRAGAAPATSDDGSSTPARALSSPAIPGAMATRTDALGTAVQAAAELAEIGLTVWARTLRNALSHLPRP